MVSGGRLSALGALAAAAAATAQPAADAGADGADGADAGVVLCIGDSLTSGTSGAEEAYPRVLEGLLRDAGYKFVVRNAGNWGDTASNILDRLQRVLSDACSEGRLAYIFVLGGTNDILRGTGTAAQIVGQLRQLHDISSRAANLPRVGIMTLPPIQRGAASWDAMRLCINRSLRWACSTQKGSPSAPPRRFLVDLESVDAALSSDGVHFSGKGYAEFARRAFEAMLPTLVDVSAPAPAKDLGRPTAPGADAKAPSDAAPTSVDRGAPASARAPGRLVALAANSHAAANALQPAFVDSGTPDSATEPGLPASL